MSDALADSVPGADSVPSQPQDGSKKGCIAGCALLIFAPLLIFLTASLGAKAQLQERSTDLRKRVKDFRKAQARVRKVIFGPARDGNAADDYNALEWVLGPRPQWNGIAPPKMPKTLPRDWPNNGGTDPLMPFARLMAPLRGSPDVPTPADLAVFRAYRPLMQHIKDGLACRQASYDYEFERGAAGSIMNLLAYRHGANLLSIAALRAEPAEAVELGLQILAFGADVGRHPTLIGKMMAAAIQAIGVRSLNHTMRERRLSEESLLRIFALLPQIELVELGEALEAETLLLESTLATLSGHPLDPERADYDGSLRGLMGGASGGLAERLAGIIFNRAMINREWKGYQHWFARFRKEIGDVPAWQRGAATAKLERELKGTWLIVAKITIPNIMEARAYAEAGVCRLRALRLVAAAQLYRRRKGAFPSDQKALLPLLGGKPSLDPFRKPGTKAMTLRLEGRELRVYSYGQDGKDDQGTGRLIEDQSSQQTTDVGLITWAPGSRKKTPSPTPESVKQEGH